MMTSNSFSALCIERNVLDVEAKERMETITDIHCSQMDIYINEGIFQMLGECRGDFEGCRVEVSLCRE